jgi:glycosyltransferase involved in cell wall biosynthesis
MRGYRITDLIFAVVRHDRGNVLFTVSVSRGRNLKGHNKVDHALTIAHFMPWSGIGGVEIATLRMVEATREQFRHIAFCLDDAVLLKDSFQKLGIETITYTPPEPSLRHLGRYYKESRAVTRLLRNAGVNIVHFADEKAAYHNSLAALLTRTRTICHLRTLYPHLSIRQRICLLPVHSFIFVSKEAKQSFALSLPDSKARVIYDAIEIPTADTTECDATVRRELGIPPGCAVIGMIARVGPVKDYYTLAAAAAEVIHKHPDTRFLVVGDNSLVDLNRKHYEEVDRKLQEFGIADRFIFTGHRDDVLRLIAAMDISVLCTHREGFPLSILELMAMRKPVIATAVGGIPEIVKHGVTGYLHQHGHSKELADAIISLIENPEEANRIAMAGYEHVRRNYSSQKFVNEISAAYSDVIRR